MSDGPGDSYGVRTAVSTVEGLLRAMQGVGPAQVPEKTRKQFLRYGYNALCWAAIANNEVERVSEAMKVHKETAGDDQERFRELRDEEWKKFCEANLSKMERAAKHRSDVMNIS